MITYGDMLNVVMVVVDMEVDKVAAEVADMVADVTLICILFSIETCDQFCGRLLIFTGDLVCVCVCVFLIYEMLAIIRKSVRAIKY